MLEHLDFWRIYYAVCSIAMAVCIVKVALLEVSRWRNKRRLKQLEAERQASKIQYLD